MNVRHLRVVGADETHQTADALPARPDPLGQLSLVFDVEPVRRIVVAALDGMHGTRLIQLMTSLHPVLVMDLRHSIRFDLPGTSRSLFLDRVAHLRSCYMREPIEWHRLEIRPATVGGRLPPKLHHEVVERGDGNLMLLVAKPEHGRHVSSMLNLTLAGTSAQGWTIEQAG